MANLKGFLETINEIEQDHIDWFDKNNVALIQYFKRIISPTQVDYVLYEFNENKLPRLPKEVRFRLNIVIKNGTFFEIK